MLLFSNANFVFKTRSYIKKISKSNVDCYPLFSDFPTLSPAENKLLIVSVDLAADCPAFLSFPLCALILKRGFEKSKSAIF